MSSWLVSSELADSATPRLSVREFETSAQAVLGCRYGPGSRTQENRPLGHPQRGLRGELQHFLARAARCARAHATATFALGNVAHDRSWKTVIAFGSAFAIWRRTSRRGVDMCRQSCEYFAFCGGGPPANKFFENGTIASTETLFCRLHKKACLDVALTRAGKDPGGGSAVVNACRFRLRTAFPPVRGLVAHKLSVGPAWRSPREESDALVRDAAGSGRRHSPLQPAAAPASGIGRSCWSRPRTQTAALHGVRRLRRPRRRLSGVQGAGLAAGVRSWRSR